MKTLTFIMIIYLVAPMTHGCLSLGWEEDLRHKEGQTALKNLPKITVVEDKGDFVEIKVENDTGEDLTYNGYSEDDPPCYFKVRNDLPKGLLNDGWRVSHYDMYWGGIEQYTLKKGASVVFRVKPMMKICQIYSVFKSKVDGRRYSVVKIYENKG